MKSLSLSIVLTLFFTSTIWAQGPDGAKQRKLLRTAQLVLEEIRNSPDHKIPAKLISKAKAIIVFPTMVKAGFFVGARYGKGVASMRAKETGEWGAPAFLYTAGGSFGFQFGAEAIDLILLVMTLAGLPLEFREGPSTTGLIAILRGPANGRTGLLRGDMDWTNAYMVTISVALLATGGAFVARALWSKRFSAEPATTVQAG